MVAVIGIVIAVVMHSLFLVAGFLAAFLPGLAVLQFAWAKKSTLGKVAGFLLLAAPVVVVAISEQKFISLLKDHGASVAYALCFFPGLLILLHKANPASPYLGLRSVMIHLTLLLVSAAFASVVSHAHMGLLVFVMLGFLIVLVFNSERAVLAARVSALVLCLAPIAATVFMALPRHLELNREMEAACASGAGMRISAASTPVSVIAMDLAGIYDGSENVCGRVGNRPPYRRYTPRHQCFALVHEGLLAGIEVGGDGWNPRRMPNGLYRYQTRSPEEVKAFGLSPRQEEEACGRPQRFINDGDCIGFGPIEALSADHVVRRRGSVPDFAGISAESFEIIERNSGQTVAQTTGFFITDGNEDHLLAAPLQHLLPRADTCAENGPPLLPFLEAFIEASR